MTLIRNIIFYIQFLPATIIACSSAIIAGYVQKSGDVANRVGRIWGALVLRMAGVRLELDLGGLDPHKAYLFMVNHQSMLDIPIVLAALKPYKFGYVAKESLYDIPLFGHALLRSGHIAIDRSNPRKAMKSIEQAQRRAADGWSIVIFPEGTRNPELGEFKIGGMVVALKTGIPVVPVVITGSHEVLPKGSLWIRPRPVLVKALPPIDASARYTLKEREVFKNDLRALMANTEAENRQWLQATSR